MRYGDIKKGVVLHLLSPQVSPNTTTTKQGSPHQRCEHSLIYLL